VRGAGETVRSAGTISRDALDRAGVGDRAAVGRVGATTTRRSSGNGGGFAVRPALSRKAAPRAAARACVGFWLGAATRACANCWVDPAVRAPEVAPGLIVLADLARTPWLVAGSELYSLGGTHNHTRTQTNAHAHDTHDRVDWMSTRVGCGVGSLTCDEGGGWRNSLTAKFPAFSAGSDTVETLRRRKRSEIKTP
jgi:hypothetical protein